MEGVEFSRFQKMVVCSTEMCKYHSKGTALESQLQRGRKLVVAFQTLVDHTHATQRAKILECLLSVEKLDEYGIKGAILVYHNSFKPAEDAVTNGLLPDFCMARQQLMLWKMFVPCVTKIGKSLGVSAGLVYALGLNAWFFTKDKLK
jgi:hypothetical protein